MHRHPLLLGPLRPALPANAPKPFPDIYGTYPLPVGGMSSSNRTSTGTTYDRRHVLFNFGTGAGFGWLLGGAINAHLGWEGRFGAKVM